VKKKVPLALREENQQEVALPLKEKVLGEA
jgi:hypothetical protein